VKSFNEEVENVKEVKWKAGPERSRRQRNESGQSRRRTTLRRSTGDVATGQIDPMS
jgi:hypothetical protein